MKRTLTICLFSVFLHFSATGQNEIIVSPETKHQTVEGWGVSLAWWTNSNYTGNWNPQTLDMLARAAVEELNYNVFRFSIGGGENPDYPENRLSRDGRVMPGYRTTPQADGQGWGINDLSNDFGQINMMDRIAEYRQPYNDIITDMISYSCPWWMTFSGTTSGAVNGNQENLKPEFYDDFADYLASVTRDLRIRNPSWNIQYIEPFNEPLSTFWIAGGRQDGMQVYPATQAQVLWRLWQRLNAYDIGDLKLTAADNTSIANSISNMNTLKTDHFNEFKGLSKISTHSYKGTLQEKSQLAIFAKENNLDIWQTETGPLSWRPEANNKPGWWARHYDIAYRLIEDMRNLKATVWMDWQLLSTDNAWGMFQHSDFDFDNPTREGNIKRTKSFYCRKNVTNFIKQGYKIIDTSNDFSLGALSPDESELVLVIVNNEGNPGSPIDFNIDLSKFNGVSSFRTFRTSGTDIDNGENTEEKTDNTESAKGILIGSTLYYKAPPYSVTTLQIQLGANANLTDGTYYIEAKHSEKYMNVAGGGDVNGAPIRQYEYVDQDNLKFEVRRTDEGDYIISPIYSDKVVSVENFMDGNLRNVQLWEDFGAPSQRFRIDRVDGDFYRITPRSFVNQGLAVNRNSTNNGAKIVSFNFLQDYDNFLWSFIPLNAATRLQANSQTVSTEKSRKNEGLEQESVIEIEQLSLFPNPSKIGEYITIANVPKKDLKMRIFNLQGYLMLEKDINNPLITLKLDSAEFTSGTYFFVFYNKNEKIEDSKIFILN